MTFSHRTTKDMLSYQNIWMNKMLGWLDLFLSHTICLVRAMKKSTYSVFCNLEY